MNDFTRFVSQKSRLDQVFFYIGALKEKKDTLDAINMAPYKEVFFYSENEYTAKLIKDNCPKAIYTDSLPELKGKTALVFSISDMCRLPAFFSLGKFTEIFGVYFGKGDVPFSIWEKFRLTSEHIEIVSSRGLTDNKLDRSLVWNKHESDIELSVIYPMYNVAAYLEQCIKTTTAWKAPYVEFLFVDDGSPDNSAEIIREYSKIDPRIKLISKENGGCASARQIGLEAAKGNYIGLIDPDDFTDDEMFYKLFKAAMLGGYEYSFSGYNEYYETTGEFSPVEEYPDCIFEKGCYDQEAIYSLLLKTRIAIWRGIYSRDLLNRGNIGFHTELPRFDDLPFKMEVGAIAKSAVFVPEHLYNYRLARPGQDVSANDKRLYVHFDIFKHLDEYYNKINAKETNEALLVCKLNTHIWAIEKIKDEFLEEYCAAAKKDFEKYGYKRGKKSICGYVGRTQKKYFKYIFNEEYPKIRKLKAKSLKKQEEALKKLVND